MYKPLSDPAAPPRTAYTPAGGAPLACSPLSGATTADVVVVGGGFVGCAAALHLAEAGRDVVLLENNEIGWGSAGRNAGHVAPHASKLEPETVLSVYGPHYGPKLNEVGTRAPEIVTGLAERLGIDISVVRGGILTGAHCAPAFEKLRRRAQYWQERGAPVELLDRRRTAETVGGEFYVGSVIDRRGIAINPLAFVRGLGRAALSRGARIHERSPVVSLAPSGEQWQVSASGGSVRCRQMLLCTNAYTDRLWPGLRETVVPVRGYQIWSKPIPDDKRGRVLRGLSAMLDTRRLPTGLRLHPDGRLQFSGGAGIGRERVPDLERSVARVLALMPTLGAIEIEGWWSGWITRGIADGWRLHRLAPGVLTAIGCNGRGVGMGVVMGQELARCALGVPEEDLIMPMSAPRRLRGYAIHEPVVRAVLHYYGWRDRRDLRNARDAAGPPVPAAAT